jgi:Bacteriophage tail sheath protein
MTVVLPAPGAIYLPEVAPRSGSATAVVLGAPGVYYVPEVAPRVVVGVRMDVAAFAGIAPRGPAFGPADRHAWPFPDGVVRTRSVPVAVESWDEYVDRFGAFEGPGLLPHAVAAFFQQGGRRAYVVRIVPYVAGAEDGSAAVPGRSSYEFDSLTAVGGGTVALTASNEGSWGDRLSVTLSFATFPLTCHGTEDSKIVLDAAAEITAGAWLRLLLPDGSRVLRSVNSVLTRGKAGSTGYERAALLDGPVAVAPAYVERVDAVLDVVDRDPVRTRAEHFDGLGLLPAHPNWIGQALAAGSNLVELTGAGDGITPVDVTLAPLIATRAARGADRYACVSPDDFFGTLLEGGTDATDGLDALLRVPEVASIVAPDLYSPAPVPVTAPVADPPTFAGATFAECVEAPGSPSVVPRPAGLDRLRLDPLDASELATIVALQNQLVSCAELLDAVALLDVPRGLTQREILGWRANFDSSHAAAYHPWLRAPLGTAGSPLVDVNPSAFAAGIIARTERAYGVPHGPANELAAGAVAVTDRVDPVRHAALHPRGIDVYLLRPDGIRLMGARTLSQDPSWRQLSVRRVVSLVERTIRSELAWAVFEPNDRTVRDRIELLLGELLRQLFAKGAFAGASPAESYFVRTASDAALPLESDAGQLVCQVGLAVAEPLEFILVSIFRDASGALTTETSDG